MFVYSNLATLITWGVNFSYLFAILPQIYLNYKIKTTNGLSDFYLLGYFSGYVINFFYVFSLDFNLAYKVRAILSVILVFVIFFQRFKYDHILNNKKKSSLYFSNFMIFILVAPLYFYYPKVFGHASGWILLMIWSLYQLPQVFKVYKQKSFHGFSIVLVYLIGIGNLLEFGIAYIFNYPIQTQLIAIRGMIVFFIFLFQFYLYNKSRVLLKKGENNKKNR